jgi:hypothetical protein
MRISCPRLTGTRGEDGDARFNYLLDVISAWLVGVVRLLEPVNSPPQAFLERTLGLPTQKALGLCVVTTKSMDLANSRPKPLFVAYNLNISADQQRNLFRQVAD